ncbi:hypothetical protein CEK25_008863 [Fusarium fujikuroi]|nr:hypothetical protein CEK25_008863 [Fusarium fujikuroi]
MEAAYLVQLIGESAEGETATSSENSPVYLEPLKILPRYSGERKLQRLVRYFNGIFTTVRVEQFTRYNRPEPTEQARLHHTFHPGFNGSTGDRPTNLVQQSDARYSLGLLFTSSRMELQEIYRP